ncbi:amidohydrolase family protein [Sphingomonas sp. So64.6b]|uniref:amidohydrolase family protein n=1 Tax=Sphingomonas sp. So64.6b TaxID=2997354 RepID=UPI001600B318|nr:amidohydrolase family protein [Sphingomonas sp. So64.6b]QNA86286.1 amidohydrolase family protein [Sphingomonas sp. So64.6b]
MARGGLMLAAALAAAPLSAQEAGEPPIHDTTGVAMPVMPPQQPPGGTLPMKPARHLKFEADRGTWLSLDRSPDGRRIVFDLLGDLYAMPASGGRAARLTGGMAFDTQPTFAPDGATIAFVSDRSGADNLWVSRVDGSRPRQISFNDDDSVMASPAFSADGESLFVSRYRPDLNNYELWRYDLKGKAALLVPIRDAAGSPRDGWRSSLGAVASPDGRSLYLARHVGGLDFDAVDEWTIVRRDLTSGAETVIVAEPDGPRKALNPGSSFRPALSLDGRQLAYATRREGQTELRVRDLLSGADRAVAFPVEHDQVQASMWQDLLPRYAFTADGTAILLARGGRIERISLTGADPQPIPFTAPVDLAVGGSTRQDIREERGPVVARLAQSPTVSRDGHRAAFSALGHLYTVALDGKSKPVKIATTDPAFQPSWSADSRRLTWVTWSERMGGAIWAGPADGGGAPVRVTDIPAFYTYPVFTPDGTGIVAVRSAQAARVRLYMEYGKLRDAELVMLPAQGGPSRVLTQGKIGSRPHFASDPHQVFILADDGLDRVDLSTGKRTLAVRVEGPGWYFQDGAVPVDDVRISPDGRWLLAQVAQQLHLVAMPDRDGVTVDLSHAGQAHRRLTAGGADFFEWSADGKSILWSVGSTLHRRRLSEVRVNPPDRPDWSPDLAERDERWPLTVTATRHLATGSLLLRGARTLTMAAGDAVIESSDILVTNGRIAAIGPAGVIVAPAGTQIRDVTGKTILPGFIDTHDHIATVRREVLGLQDWGLRARLAYGVTTSFDPSTLSIDMLAYQDLLDAGSMIGPRLRSTGPALFSFNRFSSLDDVRAVLRRYRDDYRLANIKEYRTGNRRVRQWIAQAARELGLQPTTEGALSMKLDLSQIIDGYAGNEHALVAAPLQSDVLRLLTAMRTSYTTTLEITNGGAEGQDWSIARDGDPASDPKLRRFWPRFAIDQMMLQRHWRPLGEYRFPAIAADAAALQRAGGLVGIGSHGETPGIGFHWEMEAHVVGGMTPMEALHAATIGSAETIGRKTDLGSLEVGKIADLVILDADPIADIRNARLIEAVMRDGRLFDGDTLAALWPAPSPPPVSDDGGAGEWLPAP